MASKISKMLWQQAIPLNKAWLYFTPKQLHLEYDRLNNPTTKDIHSGEEKWYKRLIEIFCNLALNKKRKDQLESQFKEQLETELLLERYIAFGYREIPSRSNGPVEIDTTISKSILIDWIEETIVVHQTHYSRAGILSKAKIDELKNAKTTESTDKSNSAMSIDNAINYLKTKIPNFGNRSRKADYNAIVEFLNVDPGMDYGYSFSKVSKAIVRICGKKR